jgi:hypothetical protein
MTSETVTYNAPKIGGLRRKFVANWMAGAVKPSHRGLFKRKAERAGVSTAAFASEHASDKGTLGREARLAQTFARFRPRHRVHAPRLHTLADHVTKLRAKGAFGKRHG